MKKGICIVFILLLCALFLVPEYVQAEEAGKTLYLGRISRSPRKHLDNYKKVGLYLVSQMEDLGYNDAKVVFTSNIGDMAALLANGDVDMVPETLMAASYLHKHAGANVALRELRNGVRYQRTIFFTRKDSGIESINDLPGTTIAFEDRGSTSAYFAPKNYLVAKGQTLQLVPRAYVSTSSPKEGNIGYAFAEDELNVTAWVFNGKVSAGALGEKDWNDPERVPDRFREHLEIFAQTEPYLRSLMVLRGDLDTTVTQRLTAILMEAKDDPLGRRLIKGYRKATGYEELSASDRDMISAMAEQLDY